MQNNKKLFGWYSRKQEMMNGYLVYRSPSGEEVGVTEVTSENEKPFSVFDDIISVGEVTEFVKCSAPERLNRYDASPRLTSSQNEISDGLFKRRLSIYSEIGK